ncbi:hypothetical protein GGTG_06397 [Gaeumannomyces tritici R3-111a-1]|uniref:Isotrichodermin C-15 hydroxylase n=1 Tax=Gaeumannomyces tritici (strain R3-111a-1) TaxID=644352 RepID=J3NYP5_GAET3|nr:hypothetical protein GGTG_06397 [Gaeumannomyces tritici R3-111a-1]EJT76478.1 hypothetical protein GGTG_06397 [Gaeumannomyces tritici R3-111a-1]
MPSIKEAHWASLLETDGTTGRLALWAGLLGATLVLYGLGIAVYRIWFHPLSKFPGPVSMALTEWTFLYKQHMSGTMTAQMGEMHRKYGKIVRVCPNRILVEGSIGWNDVYAHRPGGDATEFHKPFNYFFPGDQASLIGAPTRDDHRRQRRQLAHAFSEAAMVEQAPIIMFYIELFIQRLAENSANGQPVDMLKWLNFVTFDIIGDLSLGESFHSLETSDYHPWVLNIFNGIRGINKSRFLKSLWPVMATLYGRFESSGSLKASRENLNYAREKARARLALGPEPLVADREQVVGLDGKTRKMTVRRDFMTYMMRNGAAGSDEKSVITEEELLNNAFLIITAGSETTGTNLSTLFYMLGLPSNRAYRDTVAAEVRAAFSDASEMNLLNVNAKALPLLHACIEESLRYHCPITNPPPRISRGAPVGGHYIPKGVVINVSGHATFRSPEHFFDAGSWRPERFLPAGHAMYDARFANDDTSVFKPFSHGPRDCIGKNLSYAEMRLVAANVLLRFDVDLHPDTPADWLSGQRSFGIWEKGPLMLRLDERKDLVAA